jgi:cation-transporting ATPase E
VTDPGIAHRELARFAASAGERNRTLETIAGEYPGEPEAVTGEIPFSSEWKWSALTFNGGGESESLVLGAPDLLVGSGALTLTGPMQTRLEAETAIGRRVVVLGKTTSPLPAEGPDGPPAGLEPVALVVLEENLRPGVAETLELMRSEEVDLKLISGDAKATVISVAKSVGLPEDAGVIEGHELPEDDEELPGSPWFLLWSSQKRLVALSARAVTRPWSEDGVNDVPALKHGGGDELRQPESGAWPTSCSGRIRAPARAVAEAAASSQHPSPGRLYLTKSVYAAALIMLVSVPASLSLPAPA